MNYYFSTFIVGFEEFVLKQMRTKTQDFKKLNLLNGLIVYQSSSSVEYINKLKFLNNSFILIKEYQKTSLNKALKLAVCDKEVIKNINDSLKKIGKTYRVIFSRENQIVSSNNADKENFINILSKELKVDKANPETELWFLERSEGYMYVGVRITRPDLKEKHLQKGELRPELTNILCILSEPDRKDRFLDPFSGSGAIVKERLKEFPFEKIFVSEIDIQKFRKLQVKFKNYSQVVLGRWDVTDLSSLKNNSVNKIVTDPPWAMYSKGIENIEEFYNKMLREFSRVLIPGGLMVVLMGQKEIFDEVLSNFKNLEILEKKNILVSGKKANVYKVLNMK